MDNFVKIIVRDGYRVLQHKFQRVQKWGYPAGKVDPGESMVEAAVRELLERTGYQAHHGDLRFIGHDREDFVVFEVPFHKLYKVAEPGDLGGYVTQIRWVDEKPVFQERLETALSKIT